MNSGDETMCDPQQQALERALAETEEEWRDRIAASVERIPADRLIEIINANMGE
jgi:uncharacterized Zn finger protein